MLRAALLDRALTCAGDEFVMEMFYEEFGNYTMLNRVVEFDANRRISWEPTRHDISDDADWHHRWGFDLVPEGPSTIVTEFYDCTRSPIDAQRILKNGTRWTAAMQRSLELLDQLVTGGSTP